MSATLAEEASASKPAAEAAQPPPAPSPAADNASTPTLPEALPGSDAKDGISFDIHSSSFRDILIGTGNKLVTFSAKMAETISEMVQTRAAERCLHDPESAHRLLEVLKRRRLLILTADADSGKGAFSLLLAHELKRSDSGLTRETLRVRSLEAEVRVEVPALASDKLFRGRVVLFKDALARANRDLRAFMASLDEPLLEQMRHDLESSHSYLIFTADTHSLAELATQLSETGIRMPLPALSLQKLRHGLNRTLAETDLVIDLSPDQIDETLHIGRTMPRVIRLVRDYLPQVRGGKMRLEDAFRYIDDASSRFQDDLAEDCEAWCFAFVLGLALAVSPADGIPWTEFERLRRSLHDVIVARGGPAEKDPLWKKERISDDSLLRKTQSIVERDLATGRDTLKFQDPADAERLWFSMLTHNRGLLTDVYPVLMGLVENSERSDFGTRARAARIIGRLGEIDPLDLTASAIKRWAAWDKAYIRASIGYLFEGVWSSRSASYRELCLAELEDIASANGASEEGRNKIWTAIAAYKRIAAFDLSLAMRKLRDIAERYLSVPIASLRDMEMHLRKIQREFEKKQAKGDTDVAQLIVSDALIREWASHIYERQAPILFALQYALVAMCIRLDSVQVLSELKSWLTLDDGLRAVTVLIYLQKEGIAEEMDECSVWVAGSTENAEAVPVSPLISQLMATPESAESVAKFLECIFVSNNQVFPAQLAAHIRGAFFGHLFSMAKRTAHHARGLAVLEDVFVCLLKSRISDLKIQLLDKLRADPLFRESGSLLEKFARNVRRRAQGEE